MKRETNNEIDLLLRRMSRHNGSVMRDGETPDQHLDADELSSYAQNALPPAARVRYTEHLAECSTCRKLATELSLSLGATAAAAAPLETVPGTSGLKKFLASLFSPMVLRYAVPALGLIIVAAVGFVIVRQQGQKDFVAQVGEREKVAPVNAAPEAAAPSDASGLVDAHKEKGDQAGQIAEPKTSGLSPGVVAGAPAGAVPAPAAPVTVARDEKVATEPQPTAAEAPPPQATPVAKAAAPAKADTEEFKKAEAAKKADAVAVETKEAEVSTNVANEPVRSNMRRPPKLAAQKADDNKAKDAPVAGTTSAGGGRDFSSGRGQADSSETRTVAGRRFQKQRGIWTDTAYDSSTAITNVARGSEQFRALVADEPEIKKIAEQLDGEVIVVWKGRAYRIR
jgi:hypothetical protein